MSKLFFYIFYNSSNILTNCENWKKENILLNEKLLYHKIFKKYIYKKFFFKNRNVGMYRLEKIL